MSGRFRAPTVFDHVEAARKLNKAIIVQAKAGNLTPDLLITMATAQAKNLECIEDVISGKLAEFHDLPAEAMIGLNQMIREGETAIEIDLLDGKLTDQDGRYASPVGVLTQGYGAPTARRGNVVHVKFGEPQTPNPKPKKED